MHGAIEIIAVVEFSDDIAAGRHQHFVFPEAVLVKYPFAVPIRIYFSVIGLGDVMKGCGKRKCKLVGAFTPAQFETCGTHSLRVVRQVMFPAKANAALVP